MKLAVIPARIGSKGLKEKNLAILGGRPLIAHTILAAIESQIFDRILVTSDGDEILKACLSFNVAIYKRPEILGGDGMPLAPVVMDAVNWIEKQGEEKCKTVTTLQPTSPFRTSRHIREAYDRFVSTKSDSLISVREERHGIWKLHNGYGVPIVHYIVNRQEVAPVYTANGAIFITKTQILLEDMDRIGGKVALFVMDEESSLDIHTREDLDLAEWYIRRRKR
jgi:N-acylneuraminate cytidylyltransferase